MSLEEGELGEIFGPPHIVASRHAYDPAYEWPGDAATPSTRTSILEHEIYSHTHDHNQSDVHMPSHSMYPTSSRTPSRPVSPPVPTTAPAAEGDNPKDHPSLRLVIEHSTIRPSKQRLAVLDGYFEVQLGRDLAPSGTDIPRVRLKDMEVSKLHATLFWDKERKYWAVVDMGSKHGTYIRPGLGEMQGVAFGVGESGETKGQRLSAPRTASIPRELKHLDRLTAGGTTFVIHIHDDRLPCLDCSVSADPRAGDEIPLFPTDKKRKREVSTIAATATSLKAGNTDAPQDAKRALTSLRRNLLSRHSHSPSPSLLPSNTQDAATSHTRYIDRSAKRRALHHSSSSSDVPGLPSIPKILPTASTALSTPMNATPTRHNTCSSPPAPSAESWEPPPPPPAATALGTSNIGHKLLIKQGWQPGTALGPLNVEGASKESKGMSSGTQQAIDAAHNRTALIVPLEVTANSSRAGLGMAVAPSGTETPAGTRRQETNNWTRRRWQDMRDDGN